MTEPMTGPITRCPWCSAPLPNHDVAQCPSCQAQLTSKTGSEPQLPGVTTLDAQAILNARSEAARPRSGILSFITGEAPPATGGPASPESLARPSDDVRREMLRLQLEAEVADLEAETVALKSDALAEQGISLAELAAADARAAEASGTPGDAAATDAAPAAATAVAPATDQPPAPPPAPAAAPEEGATSA